MRSLKERADELRCLAKTDPDPRVRRRAQALFMLAQGASVLAVARWFRTASHRVRVWREWFVEGGRDRLADDPRCGRPPKLGPGELTVVDDALERGPQAYGWPVTNWSIRDVCAFLWQERGIRVSVYTVHRAVRALGYRYRRPRHDLRHRQDRQAVAAMKEVLAWLGKAPSPGSSIWSTSMSAKSTLPPSRPRLAKIWRRRGVVVRVPAAGEDHG
ncbi:MAG TPA: winged helix-turn-helix domain-containing protein [Chloroflexota bacterium]|nr:winged helix-turn-helix domain-containing protein [Chloroflexota bacterium]